jgi:hypothetical protein
VSVPRVSVPRVSVQRAAGALWLAGGWLAAGCGSGAEQASPPRIAAEAPARPVDSLALRAPDGTEVWFTDSRSASDSAGVACTERVMELRRAGTRIPVPLLYTGERPALVNDSTFRAHIWLHCRPGNLYEVSLRTGFPTRVMP